MRTGRGTGSGMGRGVAVAVALMAFVAGACGGQERAALGDEELGVMIDSLLPPIAEASGMAVRQPVRFAVQSRADARRFIESELDDELGPEELHGMTRTYRLFGLIPDTLDLRRLLLDLYTEQVVGYYDPRTDQLYVVEGAEAATAAPVVAHELVHALQDQHADLDSLVARERGNDRQMAAQAAAEGQATLVMLALQAAETTGQAIDPGALPDLGPMIRPAMEEENERFPVFATAPPIIRETLLFPYLGGAEFMQALYRRSRGAPPVPFGDLLPQSTEQVLHPERAFFGERDAPTEIGLGPVDGGWSVVYENTLGQLETSVLLETLGGAAPDRPGSGPSSAAGGADAADASGAAGAGWDGDRYALLAGPDGREALVWYSVWDDAGSADRVAGRLRDASGWRVERMERDGRPLVRVVIAPGRVDLPIEDLLPVAEVSLEEVPRL